MEHRRNNRGMSTIVGDPFFPILFPLSPLSQSPHADPGHEAISRMGSSRMGLPVIWFKVYTSGNRNGLLHHLNP